LKFCPKCGSDKIYWASGLPQLWSIWECKECGYRGALVIEDSELATKIRERYLKGDGKEKAMKR
jgi:DNA-directed RNA polymerase subunit M